MQFAVLLRATDTAQLPPQAQMALAKRTFQMFTSNREPHIVANYPFAGERAGILIIEATSGEELQEVIGSLPLAPLVTAEIHPIGSVEANLKTIESAERLMAEMMPAGVR